MTRLQIVLWVTNLALDTMGQVVFKAAAADRRFDTSVRGWAALARRPLVWAGIACYAVEFVTWLAFLSLVPLSTAVLLAAINVVTVMLAGRLLFREPGGMLRTAGILLVAAGVAVVGWGGT